MADTSSAASRAVGVATPARRRIRRTATVSALRGKLIILLATSAFALFALTLTVRALVVTAHPWSQIDPVAPYEWLWRGAGEQALMSIGCNPTGVVPEGGNYYRCDQFSEPVHGATILIGPDGWEHVTLHSRSLRLEHLINHWGLPERWLRLPRSSLLLRWNVGSYTVQAHVTELSGYVPVSLVEIDRPHDGVLQATAIH